MFYYIGDVRFFPVDARRLERVVEKASRRPDERMSGLVLFVTRLFADEHHFRPQLSLAEHGLRAQFIKLAAHTSGRRVPQRRIVDLLGKKVESGFDQAQLSYDLPLIEHMQIASQKLNDLFVITGLRSFTLR